MRPTHVQLTARVPLERDPVMSFFYAGEAGAYGERPVEQYATALADVGRLELAGEELTIYFRHFGVAPKTFQLLRNREVVVCGLELPAKLLHAIELVEEEPEPMPERSKGPPLGEEELARRDRLGGLRTS